MSPLRKYFIKYGMQGLLQFLAFFARKRSLTGFSEWLTRVLANLVIKQKNIQPATSLKELGIAWQNAFAAKKMIPITAIDQDTVYAEIRIKCPLKGTGDTMACYKMMNFDRKILEKAGGQFIVLQSQATPGINYCKIAMRFKDVPADDLVPAHEKNILFA